MDLADKCRCHTGHNAQAATGDQGMEWAEEQEEKVSEGEEEKEKDAYLSKKKGHVCNPG